MSALRSLGGAAPTSQAAIQAEVDKVAMAPPGVPTTMAVTSGVPFQPDADRSCRINVICSLSAVISTSMTATLAYSADGSTGWTDVNAASSSVVLLAAGQQKVTVDAFVKKGHYLRCTVQAWGLGATASLSAVKQTF